MYKKTVEKIYHFWYQDMYYVYFTDGTCQYMTFPILFWSDIYKEITGIDLEIPDEITPKIILSNYYSLN